jgi:hypothetical protein
MSDPLREALNQAEHGDLRPQVNDKAPICWQALPADLQTIEPILVDRFFQLARPIADARTGATADMRLQDAGPFFYLLDTLKRFGSRRLTETLLILLDEFSQLTPDSYNELYLWCIIELSRTDPSHFRTFWPQVIALDLQYRPQPWQRPAGAEVFEQPHWLTELVLYYYVLYTLKLPAIYTSPPSRRRPLSPYLSLGRCVEELVPLLSEEQIALVRLALKQLIASEPRRAAFGDALGLLTSAGRRRKQR